jgi:hypothetical protein
LKLIVDPDFFDHWRTGMVIHALNDQAAPVYIMRLWAHCQERKADSFVMPAAGLRAQCKCPADPETFEKALIDAGFIERNGANIRVIGVDRWLVRGRVLDIKSTEWDAIRLVVFNRDGYVCRYCGVRTEKPECDHVLPLSRGGRSVLENLATSCMPCNRSKGSKTVAEWRA